jgi:hypothetical protein
MPQPKQAASKATALRHLRMRNALQYIGDVGVATAVDIAQHTEQSVVWARSSIRDLISRGMIDFAHYKPSSGNGPGYSAYRLQIGALHSMDDVLPIWWHGRPVTLSEADSVKRCRKPSGTFESKVEEIPFEPHRDPLVAFIHGFGRAPSLNFMDSIQGEGHAESKATDEAH